MFGKKIEETKVQFSTNLREIIQESKLIAVCVIGATCLTAGYILGAVTTGAMCRTLSNVGSKS